MKLIIDVPKEFYETIKTTLSYRFNYLEEKVRQATPLQEELEEIKSEINAKERVELSTKEMWYNFALADVTHIIDNHIKELAELKGENK